MFKKLPESTDNVLGYEARDETIEEEFTAFAEEFEAATRVTAPPNCRYTFLTAHTGPRRLWEDLKFFLVEPVVSQG
jgi:hypothetical protein